MKKRLIGLLILLALLVQGCSPIGEARVRTILPADRVGYVYVLPDGRSIFFRGSTVGDLGLLDAASGQETLVSEIDEVGLLGEDLLWGRSYGNQDYYVIDPRSMSVVKLEQLQSDLTDLSEYVHAANIVYVIYGHNILLLKRDPARESVEGYYIRDVRDPSRLLAGISYAFSQGPPYYAWQQYNIAGPPVGGRFPSTDGQYYYICGGNGAGKLLQIYSQEDELVSSVTASGSAELFCHGWAWDSSGVYFQEVFIPGDVAVIGPQPWHGPLELLKVKP